MSQPRITYLEYGNSVSTFNVTIPAGVSTIFAQTKQGTTDFGQVMPIAVVPGTTYTLTVNSTTYAVNNANTFGSLYSFSGGGRLRIYWME